MSTATLHIEKRTALVPKLRFQEFEGEWQRKTLFDISKDVSYGMNAAAKSFDGIHKYLRITDIDSDSRMFKPNPLTSPEGHIDEKFKLKENDLLFTRTGASVGKSYLYNSKDGALYYAGFLIKFSILNANSYFVYSLTLKESYDKWVHVYSMRSGQPGLNAEEYKAFKISIPTLPEQYKIASFLSAVDEKIQQLSRKAALLEQYKKGVMQQLFSGVLRFKDENGKDYPDWEKKKLGEISKITTGKLDANAMIPNGEYRFYTCAKDYFRIDKFAFDTEALLISGNGANVGYIHYYKGRFNAYQRTYVLDKIKENIIYLKFYLDKFLYERIHTEKKEGNTPYIVMSTLSDMGILLPSLLEQQKIADFLSSIDDKIESTNQQLVQTKMFKKGLLQQMFV